MEKGREVRHKKNHGQKTKEMRVVTRKDGSCDHDLSMYGCLEPNVIMSYASNRRIIRGWRIRHGPRTPRMHCSNLHRLTHQCCVRIRLETRCVKWAQSHRIGNAEVSHIRRRSHIFGKADLAFKLAGMSSALHGLGRPPGSIAYFLDGLIPCYVSSRIGCLIIESDPATQRNDD